MIYCDPPWQPFDGALDPTREIENQYPTMTVEQLVAMADQSLVDAETKLISQVSFETDMPQIGTVKITGGYSEYEEYNGAMLATRTSLEIPGFATIDTRFTTTEIDVEVDHSIFEKP